VQPRWREGSWAGQNGGLDFGQRPHVTLGAGGGSSSSRRSRHGLARGERDSGRARRGAGVVAGGAGAGRQGVRTQPDHHHEQEPPHIRHGCRGGEL
jgi:hypothetical protein